jgi:hypothetical protein
MSFCVLENPEIDFVVHRVALFEHPMDAVKFILNSVNPEELEMFELDDVGQQRLLNTEHVVIG